MRGDERIFIERSILSVPCRMLSVDLEVSPGLVSIVSCLNSSNIGLLVFQLLIWRSFWPRGYTVLRVTENANIVSSTNILLLHHRLCNGWPVSINIPRNSLIWQQHVILKTWISIDKPRYRSRRFKIWIVIRPNKFSALFIICNCLYMCGIAQGISWVNRPIESDLILQTRSLSIVLFICLLLRVWFKKLIQIIKDMLWWLSWVLGVFRMIMGWNLFWYLILLGKFVFQVRRFDRMSYFCTVRGVRKNIPVLLWQTLGNRRQAIIDINAHDHHFILLILSKLN